MPRTPMQWSDGENAGFTTGTPWLPVNPNYTEINVKEQEGRPDSVLNHYRKLTALKKSPEYKEAFTYGRFIPDHEDQGRNLRIPQKKQMSRISWWRRTMVQDRVR